MTDQGSPEFPFRAFLSHSAADTAAARRLKRRLEGFSIPRSMRATGAGLGRVLVGQNEAGAGAAPVALQEQIALVEWMIVVCSPSAAASATVDAEVAAFLAARSREKLIAVLFEGEPHNALPPLLRTSDLFGVDIRPSGDGEELGVARIVARILGVEFAELRDQVFADQRGRIRNRALAAAALGAFGLTMGGAAIVNLVQKHASLGMAERAVNLGAGVLENADLLARNAGVEDAERKALLDQARQDFDRLFDAGPHNDALKARRAALMVRFADLYGGVGDAETQGAQAAAALAAFDALPERRQVGLYYVRALAAVGAADIASGREDAAVEHLSRAIAAARPLADDPGEGARARVFLADALRTLGTLHLTAGRTAEAMPLLQEAVPLLTGAVDSNPQDPQPREHLLVTLDQLSDAELAAGDRAAARTTIERSVAQGRAWRELAPESTEAKAQLAFALLKLGRHLSEENNAAAARPALTESITLMRELAAAAPREARYRSALTLLLWTTANTLVELGQNGDGLMDEAIDLMRTDVARNPRDQNMKDQLARMLAVRAARYTAARDREGAEEMWSDIVSVRRSIRTGADEKDAAPSRDLAAALEQLGDLRANMRKRDEALAAYREAVVWRRRVVAAVPQSAESEAALAAALQKFGQLRLAAEDRPGAIRSLSEAGRRRAALANKTPGDASMALLAIDTLQQTATIQTPVDRDGARASLELSIGLLERLVGDEPGNVRYRNSLRRAQQRLAQIEPSTTQ